ncbi:MAG: phosphatase PAP2 family protein [Thermomicrobiales bacterium]
MALTVRHTLTGGATRPTTIALPRLGRRAVSISLGVAFMAFLIDAMINPRAFFDVWAITAIQGFDAPGVYTGVNLIELMTSSTGAVVMWAAVVMVFAGLRWWSAAFAGAFLPVGGVANMLVGELLVERTRPHLDALARNSGNWEERSFPSGHVMGAVMLYGLVFAAARRIESTVIRRAVRGGSVAVIATVGVSRVWDGAHWPTDVLGAYALGGLMLLPLLALHDRLSPAIDGLRLIRAEAMPHDETEQHAHALTSLVRFDGDVVTKVYAPGLLPRVIYWVAFQAPFPYISNQTALRAATHRRNLAGMLTEYWYGERRVARIHGIERIDGRHAVVSERVEGTAPTDRGVAKAFLAGLTTRFEAAGLPTWQIDPVQPRAIDNVIETGPGMFKIIDLESGLVSPVASRTTWLRALRRGMVPFYDEVFYDVTRAYVAREQEYLRAAKGDVWLSELHATLDAAEMETEAWHRSEPRIVRRVFAGVVTGSFVRTWKTRIESSFGNGQEKARSWMDRAVTNWETEERIDATEAAELRAQMAEPTFQKMLPYLGGHILLSIPLRFPVGSIIRPLLVAGALGTAAVRYARGRIDRDDMRLAWQIHSPLVMFLAGIPGVGSFAYLASKPVRANRLLLRVLADAALAKAPWRLYARTGIRRYVVRPTDVERIEQATVSEGPAWELAWAARPRPRTASVRALPRPKRTIESPEVEAPQAA